MRLWLLKDGEHLPVQPGVSKMRTWMLAETMAKRGHEVIWWSSTHSHQEKRRVSEVDKNIRTDSGFELRLLDAGGYKNNVSVARVLHHRALARKFDKASQMAEKPDLLVSSFPLIGWSRSAMRFAGERSIPLVVDVRDPWPDVLIHSYQGFMRSVAGVVFAPMRYSARRVLSGADHVVAVSQGFLSWAQRLGRRTQFDADHVFRIGRHPARFSPDNAPEWLDALPTERPIICFVGMFGRVYELELVCEVARRLHGLPNTPLFVLAGAGDKTDKVRELCAGLENVVLPGWISRDDAAALMRRSAIALAPIRHIPGCVPNKIAEYLSHGLPIVSSLEGDLPTMMANERFGLSYSPGDADGLEAAILKLCSEPQTLVAMRRSALSTFESSFQADSVFERYANFLESLVDV
ncbi:MAG: glycosyltransferase family 4 protein [Pseudomonadota bacterium]